jgi:hypothetical protein
MVTWKVTRNCTEHSKWRVVVVAGALSAALNMTVPGSAHAQGFFDFLFGGPQQRPASPPAYDAHPPPPPGIGRVAPAPLGQENVNENAGSTGHGVAFCVRLCDGQHFPLEKMANGTPVETCKAICPYSQTKVFFGSEIGAAVAEDGQKYTNLGTAFVYRKQLVANCSCNGKDISPGAAQPQPPPSPAPAAGEKLGATVQPEKRQPQAAPPVAPAQGHATRQ